MDLNVVTYLLYLVLALPLTFAVARALHRYGKVFLLDVFNGDETLAHAVNQLLVIGFYLLNLGYVALFMTSHTEVGTSRRLLEVLSTKIGGVALVVGVVHFGNVWVFNAFRRRAILRARPVPPVAPVAPAAPAPGGWPPLAGAGTGAGAGVPPAYGPSSYRPAAPPAWAGWTAPGAPPPPPAA